ncbi:HAD-IA family hydrolase [Micromonospora globbae]|jgi:sugar-phosphatase|uniref:HAD-IA family hydrolase n=1 Tax=Micromonospora globbae TaxID=1894969 RepID=UPI00341D6F50|nr:HAD-IA family hydrolase [Micromonospora globbae]
MDDIEAVLLDMDGTLVDSDGAVERAWRRWAADYRVDPETVLRISPGKTALTTIRQVAPHLDDQAARRAARYQTELQLADAVDTKPLPGATCLLDTLDRLALPWAVVTSADADLAAARLGAAGITPPVLVTADDVRAGKPDPEGYRLAAARLGVPAERCLVVEDAPAGIAAGQRAGARVAALRGHPADLRIPDLHALVALLTPPAAG